LAFFESKTKVKLLISFQTNKKSSHKQNAQQTFGRGG